MAGGGEDLDRVVVWTEKWEEGKGKVPGAVRGLGTGEKGREEAESVAENSDLHLV